MIDFVSEFWRRLNRGSLLDRAAKWWVLAVVATLIGLCVYAWQISKYVFLAIAIVWVIAVVRTVVAEAIAYFVHGVQDFLDDE